MYTPSDKEKARLEAHFVGRGHTERDRQRYAPGGTVSVKWLADQIGVSRQAVWRWLAKDERGQYLDNGMRHYHWERICELFPDVPEQADTAAALAMLCRNLDDGDADLLRSIAERVGAVPTNGSTRDNTADQAAP